MHWIIKILFDTKIFSIVRTFLFYCSLLTYVLLHAQSYNILLTPFDNSYGTGDNGAYNQVCETQGGVRVQVSGDSGIEISYRLWVSYHDALDPVGSTAYTQPYDANTNASLLYTDALGSINQEYLHAAILESDAYVSDTYVGYVTFWLVKGDGTPTPGVTSTYAFSHTFNFDMVGPVINSSKIQVPKAGTPLNAYMPHYAKSEDEIQFLFQTSGEAITEISNVTIAGVTSGITYSSLGSSTPIAKKNADQNAMTDGSVVSFTFDLYDLNGNYERVTTTSDESSVILDFSPPIVSQGTTYYTKMITSDGDQYAKAGDEVILSLVTNEFLLQGDFNQDGDWEPDESISIRPYGAIADGPQITIRFSQDS